MTGTSLQRQVWTAVAAAAVCAPWPAGGLPPGVVLAVVAGLLVLGRPLRWGLAPWLGVVVALAATLVPVRGDAPTADQLEEQLERTCGRMLQLVGSTAQDAEVRRVLAVTGEAVEPVAPFRRLENRLGRRFDDGRTTLLLADQRGKIVAWAGGPSGVPRGVRPLGRREWSLDWSATGVTLTVREPILDQGRLVGAVLSVRSSSLEGRDVLGLQAPRGYRLRLGERDGAMRLEASSAPTVVVPAVVERAAGHDCDAWLWVGWIVALTAAVVLCPWAGLVGSSGAVFAAVLLGDPPSVPLLAVLMVMLAAAVGRTARSHPAWVGRALVALTVLGGAGLTVASPELLEPGWLPARALAPGWGGAAALAVAWLVVACRQRREHRAPTLIGRIGLAAVGVLLVLLLELIRLPALGMLSQRPRRASLDRGPLVAEELLPSLDAATDDLALAIARRWSLDERRHPAELVVLNAEGELTSRWGALDVPAEAQHLVRRDVVRLPDGAECSVELWSAAEPWSWLRDWEPAPPGFGDRKEVWNAVFSRSGEVEACLHREVRALDPTVAGNLYHAGGGWARVGVGREKRLAHVRRHDDLLVARIVRHPGLSVTALRLIQGLLWISLGLVAALPPRRLSLSFGTYGSRLRLLVAGGVLIPLVLLTALMQEGLRSEEVERRAILGTTAIETARWSLQHFEAGIPVGGELTRALADQLGGEVILFGDPGPVAASRPDLVDAGLLPALPLPEAYAAHLLGRSDVVVEQWSGLVIAAASGEIDGHRILLEAFVPDRTGSGRVPGVADWLLAGAALAALLVLALTGRIEERLAASLRELTGAARRVQEGRPLADVREPPEEDLAEVVRAVRRMSEEVRRREERLRAGEELLRVTLSTLEPAVLVLGVDESVRLTNPSGRRILDAHGEELMRELRRLTAGRTDDQPSVTVVRPSPGRDVTWRVGIAEAPLPDGERGRVIVVDDVTDLVRVDRLRQLTKLARIVAHEVKNPLTPVRLWVQELQAALDREGDLRGVAEQACREIGEQVERLRTTSEEFSNLVALQRWEAEAVDLVELVRDVGRDFEVLRRRGIELELEVDAEVSCVIVGDQRWLRRAVLNLIRNSLEAVEPGPGSIRVTVRASDGLVVVEVADTGGGVPPESIPELFEPYFSTTSGGSGLGLALVRMVVTRCDGAVQAENGKHGLVVRLEFPSADPLVP